MILYLPYYFSSKLKTKLLIISVKYFLPRIFLKTKDLKWSYFHILIFRFIGEEWLFWWKEESLCFHLRMKTTGVYSHSMKHYEKEDFFIQQILPKENPFFDSQFSKYNFWGTDFYYKLLGHFCWERYQIFVFARSQNNEKWS